MEYFLMKAIEVFDNRLKIVETTMPSLQEAEVLIKVKSAGVNRADIAQKNGLYPPPAGASQTLGLECSGVIESIGEGVTTRKVGEEVCALLSGGGYAEFAACPEKQVLLKPSNLNWDEAASLPEIYATCWLNLFMEGNLQPGEKVVFHAGASGIGTAGIQLCKNFGCESFVTAGTKEKIDFCIDLGASEGAIRPDDIFQKIASWAPDGVNLILDPVGASYFNDNLKVLGMDGRIIIIGLMGGIKTDINLGQLMMKRHKIIGSTIRARSLAVKESVIDQLNRKVWPLIENHSIIPVIHQVFDWENANQAHEVMELNSNTGKLILKIS
tara:strand:+ start:3808 stop:4785 length:978 start_codon:yes stop_codon:yes gene_type:complete